MLTAGLLMPVAVTGVQRRDPVLRHLPAEKVTLRLKAPGFRVVVITVDGADATQGWSTSPDPDATVTVAGPESQMASKTEGRARGWGVWMAQHSTKTPSKT
jgi:hypothetical protein